VSPPGTTNLMTLDGGSGIYMFDLPPEACRNH